MKKIILAITTLLATTAFAESTYYSYPKYDGMSVDNLCDAGNSFRSINPVQVCHSWTEIPATGDHDYPGQWVCDEYHTEHVTVSKTGLDCVKYGTGDHDAATCIEHATVQRPNTVLAEKITSYGEYDRVEYFYFTIPACK